MILVHDHANSMSLIGSYLALLKRDPNIEERLDYIEKMKSAVHRANKALDTYYLKKKEEIDSKGED